MSIKIENLTYLYNPETPMEKKALNNVSLTIEEGEFVGMIGHTGSGKSTLVQHMNGLLKPYSGKVFVNGVDIHSKEVSLRKIRQQVGMVFQYPEHQLFGETVFEDVAFGPKNMGVSESDIDKMVDRALEMVELDLDLKTRSPFELSGGQKRRVAIAGVLAMKPKILILDEPTAGLDPRGRDEIFTQIERLHQAGTTIVLVSHSMEDVARFATRLVVMANSEIAVVGSTQEVFSQANYLKEIGLGVPQITQLLNELHRQGCEVRTDLYTLDAAESEIVKLLEKSR